MELLGSSAHLFWRGRVLLILRDKEREGESFADPDHWDSMTETEEPKLDHFNLEATAIRGLDEELGIKPPANWKFLGYTRQKGHGFSVGFLTDAERNKIVLGHEGQEYRFFTPAQARELKLGRSFRLYWEAYPEVFARMFLGKMPNPLDLKLESVDRRVFIAR
jgi:hypothetical protein